MSNSHVSNALPPRAQTYRGSATQFESTSYLRGTTLPPTPRLLPIPLPPTSSEGPVLNPLLAYAACPKITYDLRRFSPSAHPHHAKSGWSYEPATSPPTSLMVLKCVILLQEVISVFPSNYQYVTVRDVLSAAYAAYQRATAIHVTSVDCEWDHFVWAGLSDQIEPGLWLLHIEKFY